MKPSDYIKLIILMDTFLDPRSRINKASTAKCFVRRWAIAHGVCEYHEIT